MWYYRFSGLIGLSRGWQLRTQLLVIGYTGMVIMGKWSVQDFTHIVFCASHHNMKQYLSMGASIGKKSASILFLKCMTTKLEYEFRLLFLIQIQ